MMQPTPAPSSPPGSPRLNEVTDEDYPKQPRSSGTAPFYVLANLFDKLQEERKHDKRRKMLDTWFTHWRNEKGRDLYPVLRLILPQKDRERSNYGLKEKNLAKTYIKLIPLGKKDSDAIRLLNWKKPLEKNQASGDFSTVLYEVVSARSSVIEGSLSIHELNDVLDELSKNMNSMDNQAKILQKVYNRSTPEEQRWIVRIILKDMNISIRENTVLSVFHPDAQDLFNSCSDLKKVAWELWDQNHRLNEEDTTVRLFSAFAPMLCKRPTKNIEETVKEMQGTEFIIEEKLDGERMQLHKRGNEYFYCSRKGKDYTYLYGKHIGVGSLTPFIDGAFDKRIKSIILDGEMLVWDPISERHLPFGSLKTAALDLVRKQSSPRPCFKVFDLLLLNGEPLLKRSTKFRKKNMRAYIKPVPGRLEFTTEFKGRTAKDIREKMEDVMEARGEGLVIKHPLSEYLLNGRNKDWIKVKPEYMDNMGETVDLLVVAGNYGSARRGSGVSTLICAVFDDRTKNDEDDDELKYSTFVRIGTGFSYADYVYIRSKRWQPWDPKNPPSFLRTAPKSHEDKGDAYLEPEDSFIVKVKAAEITTTTKFHLGLTMRFPRAIGIRDDLTVADCMTATGIWQNVRTLQKRKMNDELAETRKTVKKRKVAAKPQILPQYRGVKVKDIPIETDLFSGMRFKVESDPKSRTGDQDKQDLVKLIHVNGGTLAQMPKNEPNFFVVYDGKTTPHDIQLLIKKGIYDIVKPTWIHDCIEAEKLVPLKKRYFFSASTARRQSVEYAEEEEEGDAAAEDDDEDKTESESDASQDKPKEKSKLKTSASPPPQPASSPATTQAKSRPSIKDDPSLAEWFIAPSSKGKEKQRDREDNDEDSVTEDESEVDYDSEGENKNSAAIFGGGGQDPHGGGSVEVEDEWVDVGGDGDESQTLKSEKGDEDEEVKDEEGETKMGEDNSAMEYDTEMIFRHLVFYLDTLSNARTNNMLVKSKSQAQEDTITKSMESIAHNLTSNGGKVTSSLDESKLTHIVMDGRDIARRSEIMKRTSKPKRRYLILKEWVEACLEERTLLDEDSFAP